MQKKIKVFSKLLIMILIISSCSPPPDEYAFGIYWMGTSQNSHESIFTDSEEDLYVKDMELLATSTLEDADGNTYFYMGFYRQGIPIGTSFGVIYSYFYEDSDGHTFAQVIYTGVQDNGYDLAVVTLIAEGQKINSEKLTTVPVIDGRLDISIEEDNCGIIEAEDQTEEYVYISYFICYPQL